MKFKIKYADQIVGILSGIAIVAIIFIIFLIGSKQKWFVKKHPYYTIVQSGSSISEGMSIQYKGFGIGKVKGIELNSDDTVSVHFYILDDYIDRIHTNSIIEIATSPIGLGSSVVFYPGAATSIIEDGSFIPEKSSPEAQALIKSKKVFIGDSSDSISQLLGKVDTILGLVADVLGGAPENDIAQLIRDIDDTIKGVNNLLTSEDSEIKGLLSEIQGILSNINNLTSDPQGLVPKLLESEENKGQVSQLLGSINSTVDGLNATVDSEVPQINQLLNEVELLLRQVQDVMTGLKNNPLIKNGVPDRLEKDSATPKRREDKF